MTTPKPPKLGAAKKSGKAGVFDKLERIRREASARNKARQNLSFSTAQTIRASLDANPRRPAIVAADHQLGAYTIHTGRPRLWVGTFVDLVSNVEEIPGGFFRVTLWPSGHTAISAPSTREAMKRTMQHLRDQRDVTLALDYDDQGTLEWELRVSETVAKPLDKDGLDQLKRDLQSLADVENPWADDSFLDDDSELPF